MNAKPAELAKARRAGSKGQMVCVVDSPPISGAQEQIDHGLTLVIARFHNLCAEGILPRRQTGTGIDRDDIEIAIRALGGCVRTKEPVAHTFDLCRRLGVSVGAVITAALAVGIDVHSWFEITSFQPHAMLCCGLPGLDRA